MKKVLTLALATLGLASAAPVRVGIVFDTGGKFDKSFNQSAHEGALRASKELGVQIKDFEPKSHAQVMDGMESFAKADLDLIIGIGFSNNANVSQVASQKPGLAFGLVDDVSKGKNVASLVFSEHEGSYLVGYIAAMSSSTGVVGFMGGMDVPLIHKFEAGYRAGAKAANPRIKVLTQYIGNTPDAWNNPGKAKELAASMRGKGADIIYAAAGGSGEGVIDYIKQTQCLKAEQLPKGVSFKTNKFVDVPKSASYTKACAGNTRPMFFIGVDSNQNYLGDFDNNPATLNHGLTSMTKRVDNAVFALIKDVKERRFKSGPRTFGLRDGGVGFALDKYNMALITGNELIEIKKIRAKIMLGEIKVPSA